MCLFIVDDIRANLSCSMLLTKDVLTLIPPFIRLRFLALVYSIVPCRSVKQSTVYSSPGSNSHISKSAFSLIAASKSCFVLIVFAPRAPYPMFGFTKTGYSIFSVIEYVCGTRIIFVRLQYVSLFDKHNCTVLRGEDTIRQPSWSSCFFIMVIASSIVGYMASILFSRTIFASEGIKSGSFIKGILPIYLL